MSAVSSSFTVSSCLIWTCLLVSRRPRTWAIRRENSLLFCLPAGKCMYWEKVRILNVPICLRCAAVFPEVNAKLISTLQHVNCPSLGLHGRHTAGYTNEMRWNCDHIQYCKRSGLNITTGLSPVSINQTLISLWKRFPSSFCFTAELSFLCLLEALPSRYKDEEWAWEFFFFSQSESEVRALLDYWHRICLNTSRWRYKALVRPDLLI